MDLETRVGKIEDRLDTLEESVRAKFDLIVKGMKDLTDGFQTLTSEVRANHAHDVRQDKAIATVQVSGRSAAAGGGALGVVVVIGGLMLEFAKAYLAREPH